MASLSTSSSVSVVIPTHNEGEQLRRTVESLHAGLPLDGEIVVVDDQSDDGSVDCLRERYGGVRVLRPERRLGAAAARNFGAAHAGGETLVFADAHVRAPLGWFPTMTAAMSCSGADAVNPSISDMARPECRGFGLTWRDAALNVEWLPAREAGPYEVPLLGAGFLGVKRTVFEAVGGFDEGLTTWGYEDAELSLRLWLLGYRCLVVPGLDVAHVFRSAHPYAVSRATVLHNLLRVAVQHFESGRLARVIGAYTGWAEFASVMARLADGDAWSRRSQLAEQRLHPDGWFFDRFGMRW